MNICDQTLESSEGVVVNLDPNIHNFYFSELCDIDTSDRPKP